MPQVAALHGGLTIGPREPGRRRHLAWRIVTITLAAGVFLEAVFAGAMLSGAGWARAAHGLTASLLVASTLITGLVGLVRLRRTPRGPGLTLTLLLLSAAFVLQAALGALTAKGANLAWAHVPLGVALLGLAALATRRARLLGGD